LTVPACDRAGEVRSIVVVAAEGAQVLVAGECRHRAHIAIGPVERGGDREMAQPVRADRKTGLGAEPADDVVDRRAGQTLPFAGPVEIDEQRTGIARAKAEGKYKGQPPHARAKAPQVIELAASGRTRTEIAAALEISERSVYRILAESRPKTT
jgi:hypothetical protein